MSKPTKVKQLQQLYKEGKLDENEDYLVLDKDTFVLVGDKEEYCFVLDVYDLAFEYLDSLGIRAEQA